MSGFASIYTSLTGLINYSAALNVLSDNIANLNTPGFKGNEVLFRDLPPLTPDFDSGSGESGDMFSMGEGVAFSGTQRSFTQGPFDSTGNATDLAINGNGFFVLNNDGQQVFSQAGQFTFDDAGYLIDSVSKARVQEISASNSLSDLQINQNQINPSTPTTTIKLTGNLDSSITSTSTGTSGTTPATVPAVTVSNVIDANGKSQTLTLNFAQDATSTSTSIVWDVTVTDSTGAAVTTVPSNGQIQFNGSGDPVAGANTLQITLAGKSITLNFGDPGTTDGATSLSAGGNSPALVATPNGTAVGTLTTVTVNAQGVVQLAFSNGATTNGPQIALADFSNPQELVSIGSAQFQASPGKSGATPTFGRAGSGALGQLQSGELELSNVNLSQEFSTIVVLQNGYQGSSQVLNVANQMLEDLYKNLGGNG